MSRAKSMINEGPRAYRNLKQSTLIVWGGKDGKGGISLYKGGVINVSVSDYEKYNGDIESLVARGFIEEVPLGTPSVYMPQEKTRDVLDQDEDPDEDNIFVKQKSPTIWDPNRPTKAKKTETVEEKIEREETIPNSDVGGKTVTLPDAGKQVEDGFEGTGRTVSCVSGIENFREARKLTFELKDLNELDIIIKNDIRPTVVKAAVERKAQLTSK